MGYRQISRELHLGVRRIRSSGLTLYAVIVRRSNIRRRKHFDLLTAALNDRHLSVALTVSLISTVCLRPEKLHKNPLGSQSSSALQSSEV